jgi:hypothetical protein
MPLADSPSLFRTRQPVGRRALTALKGPLRRHTMRRERRAGLRTASQRQAWKGVTHGLQRSWGARSRQDRDSILCWREAGKGGDHHGRFRQHQRAKRMLYTQRRGNAV